MKEFLGVLLAGLSCMFFGALSFYNIEIRPFMSVTEDQCILEKQSGEVCKLNVEYIAVKAEE